MILLTGSTGFVGGHLLRAALARGAAVRCLVRDAQRARRDLPEGVELAAGDILDADSLVPAVAGVEAVVHLVGIIVETGGATFENIHYRGAVNVMNAAERAGVGRFVHMSALGTGAGARSRYHRTKWAAEEHLRASSLEYTILRPSIIYGPGDGFVSRLAEMVKLLPVVPVPGSGRNLLQPVWVEDVAACFARALEVEAAVGQTYDVAGPERMSLDMLIDTVARVLGRERRLVHMPLPLVKLSAAFMEFLLPRPPVTLDQLTMLEEDNVGDPEPARRDLEIDFQRFEETLRGYL